MTGGPTAEAPRGALHLITTLDRGGAENALLHLCRDLARGGAWAPSVAYLKGAGELRGAFEAAGVPVHDLELRGARGLGTLGRAKRLLASYSPDIVHTHLFKADTLGAALVGRRRPGRTALISTKHNEDAYLRGADVRAATWRTLARRVARRADALVAISDGVRRFFAEELGEDARSMRVIRYGVPEPPAPVEDFRARHGIEATAPLVLCVARLEPQKDHRTLLAALPSVLERVPQARLVLLGRGSEERTLRERAGSLPGGAVTFAGFTPDPGAAYAAADLVVLPSAHEGLGLVLVEAALHGRPAVATSVGGIPEVIEDGVSGLLVPPGDPVALADALSALLADPDRRRAMGAAARSRAIRDFSPEACVRATESLYDAVARSPARSPAPKSAPGPTTP